MPSPWSLLSLGTALNALAERISRMPGPGEIRSQQPARIIGRETGLSRLRGLVDPVPLASQVLLVTGEAGMGKPALLADAAVRARPAGLPALRFPVAGSVPILPLAVLQHRSRPVLSVRHRRPGRPG